RQAEQARDREKEQRLTAEGALQGEREQRWQAEIARGKEKAAREKVQEAREAADKAFGRAEELRLLAEQALYLNRIGLADRERAGNNMQRVQELLGSCPLRCEHWEWNYLSRLCIPRRASRQAGDQPISCLALSPHGNVLASGEGN